MSNWIDFKALRAQLDFEQVLKHYGVEVKRKGEQHHGYCPLPNHNGKRNSPSFSANLERGIFQCFGCGAKGNVLEFAALMEKIDPQDGAALREVGMKLQERFCPELGTNRLQAKNPAPPKTEEPKISPQSAIIVNAPLDFGLKDLDPAHPYALGRGFAAETIAHFGLGYCSRGMLKGRLAIPLHDQAGRLIGYAGRVVDNATVTEDNPRYRFPGKRKRNDQVHEFRKTRFLYNGFSFKEPLDRIVVVEGFTSVWWLYQNGLPQVVSTMGADCSEKQADLIVSQVKPGGSVWIVPDGDEAGERHALTLLSLISPHRLVRWVKMEAGKQPTDLSKEELSARFKK